MVAAPIEHISLDERGIAYIAGTGMKVSDLAIDAETWGMSVREMRDNYSHLTLGQIHAALAYYYDHREEIDAQIARETEEYEALRQQYPNRVTRVQLEQRLAERDIERSG
jgi:uncharacterized protein (DUF433 family)